MLEKIEDRRKRVSEDEMNLANVPNPNDKNLGRLWETMRDKRGLACCILSESYQTADHSRVTEYGSANNICCLLKAHRDLHAHGRYFYMRSEDKTGTEK